MKLLPLLKIVLASLLLLYLISQVGTDNIFPLLNSVSFVYLLYFFCLLTADNVVRAYNWRVLLGLRGIRVPFRHLTYLHIVGGFLGAFVPSSVGVDAVRTLMLARQRSVPAEDASSSMLVLNLVNLAALCMIALAGTVTLVGKPEYYPLVTVVGATCLSYLSLLLLLSRVHLPSAIFSGLPRGAAIVERVEAFQGALGDLAGQRRGLARACCVALCNQSLSIVVAYAVTSSLHLNISFLTLAVFIPIVTLLRLVPVSIAGFGAEQGIFIYLFQLAGIGRADAFVASVVLSSTAVAFSLMSGLLYAATNLREVMTSVKAAWLLWFLRARINRQVTTTSSPGESEVDMV